MSAMTAMKQMRDSKKKSKDVVIVKISPNQFEIYGLRGKKRIYEATLSAWLLERYRKNEGRDYNITFEGFGQPKKR